MNNFTEDGIEYSIEVSHQGDVIHVYDINNDLFASCEKDHSLEQIFCSHYTPEEGCINDFAGPRDIYDTEDPIEIARWLVSVEG